MLNKKKSRSRNRDTIMTGKMVVSNMLGVQILFSLFYQILSCINFWLKDNLTKNLQKFLMPTIEEWIKKMWYIYTMENYSGIKKNEIMPFAAPWMDPEIVTLS